MKKIQILIVFILLSSSHIFSQGFYSIHFGINLPTSDFADDYSYDEINGGAAVGFNAGYEYCYPLSDTGLGLVAGIAVFYNPLTAEYKEAFEMGYYNSNNVDITHSKYFSFPVSFGLNYTYKADEKLAVFANSALNISFLTKTNYSASNDHSSIKKTYDPSKSFGYKIGGGILIKDNFFFSINYLNLGSHNIKYTTTSDYISSNFQFEDSFKLKVSFVSFTIGLKL